MKRQHLLHLILITSFATIAATGCSGADENNASDNADTSNHDDHANHDQADMKMDVEPVEDMKMDIEPEPDMKMDVEPEPDMKMDVEPEPDMKMEEVCDPDATREELLGANTDPAVATFEVTEDAGTYTATIDASVGGIMGASMSSFVYVDLNNAEHLDIGDKDALSNNVWDLGIKRTVIRLNGADSGPGGLMIARVEDTTWETASPPSPAGGTWVDDEFISDDCEVKTYGQGSLSTAIAQWYDYDFETHAVTAPEGVVYFIYDRTTHAVFKLQIQDYNDAIYTIRWQAYNPGGHGG